MSETVEASAPVPCMNCGEPTTRLVIVWAGPLCSEACERAWETAFWEAVAKLGPLGDLPFQEES